MIIYSLLAIPISNSISENYGIKLNNTRMELGLKPITENWKLDSVEILKKNGNYCQYWKNKTNDTLNPYHRSKSITFVKSFWFWKNELKSEYDEFVNPNSKIKIITLETVYEFNENKWHERTDTLRKNRSFCATGRKNAFKSEKTTKEKIKEKLESWNLK